MRDIIPPERAPSVPCMGALAFVLERLDGALFDGGRDEDALERMAREDVAADALHDLLTEYLSEYGGARVSEAECLARLFGHDQDAAAFGSAVAA